MKVILISTDRKIFEEDSAVRRRVFEYSRLFEETHIVVFTTSQNSKSNLLGNKIESQKLKEGVFAHPTNSVNKFFYITDVLLTVGKLIGNSRKDFVVSCQDPFETGALGALIKLFYGLPLHAQVHTDFMHKYFRSMSFLNLVRFYLGEFVVKYADRVRVVSERVAESVREFNGKIDVLPIKIESRITNYGLSNAKEGKNIITVCRLEKEKNLETAIKTFKIVSEKFPEAIFTIVGDGRERKSLELIAKSLGLKDRISFVGWQNNLEEYYRNADVYISTSLYEGYGMAMMEAATFGLPIVASDTGVADDSFALICDAKDSDCFARKIAKLFENADFKKEMEDKARNFADRHLRDQENYLQKYACSVSKTYDNLKKKNFISRLFEFKMTVWKAVIFARYFVCGLTGAAINIGLLYVFTDIAGFWYLYSSVLAFIIALAVSFTLQKFVVFKDKVIDGIHRQFTKYFIAAVFGVLTNTAIIYMCVDVFGIWYVLGQIIAGFFVMIQNFFLYKFFIFNKS